MNSLFFKGNDDGANHKVTDADGAHLDPGYVVTAGVFAISATLISIVSIWSHLKNYRKPHLQRFVIRIIGMVPIYALTSWICLWSLEAAFYLDAIRDIYEAFVIYCFFNLLINYLGGERSLLILLHGRPPTPHVFPVKLFIKEMDISDPYSFLFLKRGILQYVYLKPILALLTLLLKALSNYHEGFIAVESGYVWISIIYNFSCSLTLYCLGMFYLCTKEDLVPYRPVPKFLCVKMVIFFSFWQGFAISILVWAGVIHSGESYTVDNVSVAIQDFMICFEMLLASIAHFYAFSYKDYYDHTIQSARMPIKYAFKDCIGMKDVVEDTLETLRGSSFNYRTFEPAEGMSHIGASRTSRIMAGLRYASGGASKYWVPDPNQHTSLLPDNDNDHHSLNFPDQLDPDVESMYDHSRRLGMYGDYNFPVIDANYIKPAPTNTPKKGKAKRKSTISKHKRSLSYRDNVPELYMVGESDDDEIMEGNVQSAGRKPRQLSDVVPPFRPGCVDLVKEVKDASGRRLQSYVGTIDRISGVTLPPSLSQRASAPGLDPFGFGIMSLPTYNSATPSKTLGQNVNEINGAHINGSTSYSLPDGASASSSRTKPVPINGAANRFTEKRRIDEIEDEEETDPLGVSRTQVNYLSQSVEKNAWRESLWE